MRLETPAEARHHYQLPVFERIKDSVDEFVRMALALDRTDDDIPWYCTQLADYSLALADLHHKAEASGQRVAIHPRTGRFILADKPPQDPNP